MTQANAPTLRSGVRGFYNFVLLLQFIYRLRSPRLGRLWTLAAHFASVCEDDFVCGDAHGWWSNTNRSCNHSHKPLALSEHRLELAHGQSTGALRHRACAHPRSLRGFRSETNTLNKLYWRSIGDLLAIPIGDLLAILFFAGICVLRVKNEEYFITSNAECTYPCKK